MILLGTPIYCHDVPGVLKVLMDRCCSRVVPIVEVDENAGMSAKLKLVITYQRQFKQNAPLKDKSFIILTACSTPGKYNPDMKRINHSLKVFIEDEMKGKVKKTIRITDTLFRFRKNNQLFKL